MNAATAPAPYRAPGWIRGSHAQTILPFLRPKLDPPLRRERVETADGDFWLFDWLDAPSAPDAPVVLFHGLEGGSTSHYARSVLASLVPLGWRGVVPHFRGCGGEPNRLPRAYHSGDHAEIGAMLAARATASAPRRRCTRSACRWAAARCSTGSAARAAPRRKRSSRPRRCRPRWT